jgi:O-antigen/teichoic acid export membrane protein
MLAGGILQRHLSMRVLRSREPLLLSSAGQFRRKIAFDLLRTSSRWWLTELGAIALLRTDQIFIAGFQQPSAIPAYYAAYSVLFNMGSAAMAIAEAGGVFVSRTWSADDPRAVHALVLRSTCVALTLMVSGAAVMAVIGDSFITLWLGPGHFVGRPTLLVFCITQILYVQQSLLLGFSRATENETYAPCYLAAGAVNVSVTWLLVGPFGVLGVALGTLIAQALTTSWYVPGSALQRLHIRLRTYSVEVLAPAAQTGILTTAATLIGALCAESGSNLERTAAGGLAGGAAVAAGLWLFVFDQKSRNYARRETAAMVRRLRVSRAEQRT